MKPQRQAWNPLVTRLGVAWATGLLYGVASTGAADEQGLEARFRREILPAMEALERSAEDVVCRGHRSSPYFNFEAKVNFFVKDGSRLEERIYEPGGELSTEHGASLVRCQTADYAFRLRQESRAGPYIVDYHGTDPREMERFSLHISVHLEIFVFSSHRLFSIKLSEMVSDPNFRIQKIHSFEEHGEELVEIDFDLAGSELWYDSGRMVLRPELGWSVREYELRYRAPDGRPCVDRGDIRCRRWTRGRIFPESVRIERDCSIDADDIVAVDEVVFTAVEWGKVSPERFTLTSFGIPEIPVSPHRRSPFNILGNWVFWVCLGVALGAFALMQYRYAK